MNAGGKTRRRGVRAAAVSAGALLIAGSALVTSHAADTSDVSGRTTLEARIVGGSRADGVFAATRLAAGEPHTVRSEVGKPLPGREARRDSLLYFSQLTDFQLADEESPARVEIVDPTANPAPFDAAWRSQEALNPQVIDQQIRQVNRFVDRSPVAQGDGSRARMRFAITTGDSADNQQLNETQWVVKLLEGGTLNPNSGTGQVTPGPLCPPGLVPGADEAARYTGVQDYDDYVESGEYYDPDQPAGVFAKWPRYPGLMDRAQLPFVTEGLRVPSYVTFGNHDGLVQGNQAANRAIEDVALGCTKVVAPLLDPRNLAATLNPAALQSIFATNPSRVMFVPPDPARQFVSKPQYRAQHFAGRQADGHGFAFVDPAEKDASNGAASYYAWSPAPGFRFIALDTIADAGVSGPSANGNIDNPQFLWIERQLKEATAKDELAFVFSHHNSRTLDVDIADEVNPPCNGSNDGHGHDSNPGCDLDPRSSTPIRQFTDLRTLFDRYPHMVSWVTGHTHDNRITPFARTANDGSGFWDIDTAAEADWPQQFRLLDVMDNRDGTLSIFGTVVDHSGPTAAPPSGTAGSAFSPLDFASASRAMAYNDPQRGEGVGEGTVKDRNVELLVKDPRRKPAATGGTVQNRDGSVSARGLTVRGIVGRRTRISTANRFNVRCQASGVNLRACEVTLRHYTEPRPGRGRLSTIGSGRVSMRGGTRTVAVRLNAAGRKLYAGKVRSRRVRLYFTARGTTTAQRVTQVKYTTAYVIRARPRR